MDAISCEQPIHFLQPFSVSRLFTYQSILHGRGSASDGRWKAIVPLPAKADSPTNGAAFQPSHPHMTASLELGSDDSNARSVGMIGRPPRQLGTPVLQER
eukprot:scaffold221_cov249-Pinguiococcus_pyrenoidosus.AAC.5